MRDDDDTHTTRRQLGLPVEQLPSMFNGNLDSRTGRAAMLFRHIDVHVFRALGHRLGKHDPDKPCGILLGMMARKHLVSQAFRKTPNFGSETSFPTIRPCALPAFRLPALQTQHVASFLRHSTAFSLSLSPSLFTACNLSPFLLLCC